MTTAFMVDRFGGLNVADDPTAVGAAGATDLLNVDLDMSGRVRTRAGYSLVRTITLTTTEGLAAFETTSGTSQFVAGYTNSGTRTYAAHASTGGASVATATPGNTAVNAVRWGDPTNEYLYIANGTDTVWRWTGAAFSQPAGMPTAKYLAVSASPNNRLVAANLSGLTSRVLFSDSGAPETFTYDTAPTPDTGNYVDLAPGDGSPITGMAQFKNDVYVFKKERFFVFYGEHPDPDGQPAFDYRGVDGYGSLVPPAAGDEGVFFFDGRSIWVTTGGPATRVSRVIEPLLRGTGTAQNWPGVDQAQLANLRLFYSLGRLYVKIPTTLGFVYTLVFDPKIDAWTLYLTNTPFEWATTIRTAGSDQKFTYFFGSSTGNVNKFDPALTQDFGNPIAWVWTSGLTDMGEPSRVKVSLESRVWGVGSVSLTVATDYAALPATNPALTLGTNPAVADAWQQIDYEGTLWKTSMVGLSYGGVDRLAHYLSFTKPAGVQ